ncbi:tyrosine-type recombinase/integrase [Paenibacillus selenitireducens]|uniref:tyrosine-type recombinase/integrase n=1 Tax=Paenibacillus selenitireducens TaxID=1324314 RepID=UPI00099720A1|nr:tyrosine-type recombinase/integrase [Paenibacillus selenitireducens]
MLTTQHEIIDTYDMEVELFSIWMKNQGMTKATQQAYLSDTRSFLHMIYPNEIAKLGKIDVMRFLSDRRERGAGDEARNRKLSSLRAFFKALNEMEHIQINPAALIAKSKQEKNRIPTYLEEDQLESFFQSIAGKYQHRNMAILLLMAFAGLRVGEIHRMNIQDLHQDGSIHILGKGRKWRVIPLPESMHQVLIRSLDERIEPKQSKEQGFFISQFGRRLSVRMIQTVADQTFEVLQQKMPALNGLKLSSHKLRHSFATMQIRSGTDIRTLQELLGHSSIETTQIYTHIDNKQMKMAMDKVSSKIPLSISSRN